MLVGLGVIALSALSVGAVAPTMNGDLEFSGSKIWKLALNNWVYVSAAFADKNVD
jgi:hypothetical protein